MSEEQERADCLSHAHYGNENPKMLGQMCVPCAEYNLRTLRAEVKRLTAEITEARALNDLDTDRIEKADRTIKRLTAELESEKKKVQERNRWINRSGAGLIEELEALRKNAEIMTTVDSQENAALRAEVKRLTAELAEAREGIPHLGLLRRATAAEAEVKRLSALPEAWVKALKYIAENTSDDYMRDMCRDLLSSAPAALPGEGLSEVEKAALKSVPLQWLPDSPPAILAALVRRLLPADPASEVEKAKDEALESFKGIMAGGPYQNDDGECSFCSFAPNDSEDLDHLIAHQKKCDWRVAKESLARLAALTGKENK